MKQDEAERSDRPIDCADYCNTHHATVADCQRRLGSLHDAWQAGYEAAEDFEHGHGSTDNPYPDVTS